MHVIADICVVPVGAGLSVAEHVAACVDLFESADVEYRLHSYGTTVEGDFATVLSLIQRCHEVVHEMGAPRIHTNVRFGTRTDRPQSMDEKVRRVEQIREQKQ